MVLVDTVFAHNLAPHLADITEKEKQRMFFILRTMSSSVDNLLRHIHWGKIAVEETFDVYHGGSKLKSSFRDLNTKENIAESPALNHSKHIAFYLPQCQGPLGRGNSRQEPCGEPHPTFQVELHVSYCPEVGGLESYCRPAKDCAVWYNIVRTIPGTSCTLETGQGGQGICCPNMPYNGSMQRLVCRHGATFSKPSSCHQGLQPDPHPDRITEITVKEAVELGELQISPRITPKLSGCLDELQMVDNFPSHIYSFTLIDVDFHDYIICLICLVPVLVHPISFFTTYLSRYFVS
ncbi:hypothetical protein DAPPUDRAFT_99414 [Daphnia pulex]|uniref:Dolichyl-diphosphooligosaccharide--protein glycosyltransferase subunit 1 n=1 Tax=Daphnia pulex TaxID=6669 RepID=E9G825_DAPPU|nr:hypothetical protein DAPPUDRAFT_99414 [Daphnia pulex]|eukprot:EFX84343.1 hypothetical protein DAPPUDRAFT_99414 [Daphnia pulex]